MNTIKRITCISAMVLLVASTATAQIASASEGFSFKGNPLGMTLGQFKTNNPTTPCFTNKMFCAPEVRGVWPWLTRYLLQSPVCQVRLVTGKIKLREVPLHSPLFRYRVARRRWSSDHFKASQLDPATAFD
jgi:hypothetical protein